jgi:hypothetical protein
VYGERTMANLVMDVVLFSCTFAFVTAVVIAAAKQVVSVMRVADPVRAASPRRARYQRARRALGRMRPCQNLVNWVRMSTSAYPPMMATNRCRPTNSRSKTLLPSTRQLVGLYRVAFSKCSNSFQQRRASSLPRDDAGRAANGW